jgi:L-ascorbate metabolism protein UlaG (beta-lactamase superfamily)
MKITRLSWAGLKIESPATTIYIDPLQNVTALEALLGKPKFPIFPIPKTGKANVLITHIHEDHFDQTYLIELLKDGGSLWGPEPVHNQAKEIGLNAFCAKLNETFTIGDFKITAVPAVDWIGDEQVSYVISDGKHTIFHGGDTNWHGYWWAVAKAHGPFDATFLPVNGAVGTIPHISPVSDMFGTMTPPQAVTATRVLGAKVLVPMHYAQFYNPPAYNQFPNLEEALDNAGAEQQIKIHRLKDGEIMEL